MFDYVIDVDKIFNTYMNMTIIDDVRNDARRTRQFHYLYLMENDRCTSAFVRITGYHVLYIIYYIFCAGIRCGSNVSITDSIRYRCAYYITCREKPYRERGLTLRATRPARFVHREQ